MKVTIMDGSYGRGQAAARPVLVERFLDMLSAERGASANTLDAYSRDLAHFGNFVRGRTRTLDEATTVDVTDFISHMVKEGLAASSRARRLSALKQFYRFLIAEGVRSDDPASLVGGPKRETALPKTLSIDEAPDLFLYEQTKKAGVPVEDDPARWVLGKMDGELVQQALDKLPEEYRVVAILHFLSEMPYEEIAQTPANVGAALSHAMRQIERANPDTLFVVSAQLSAAFRFLPQWPYSNTRRYLLKSISP